MSLRADLSRLLVRLRGPYTRQQVGDALGRSRTAIGDLERGEVSLPRLEWLQDFYGVDFTIVAIDRRTGRFWNETVAPGLVERIEGGLPPMIGPGENSPGRTWDVGPGPGSASRRGKPAATGLVSAPQSAGERPTPAR